ncbi:uncharacterized protein C8A04DRAFT_27047 [Dichotomopilus funicola]|uniref:Uncharacterized protein n=1 Tax=Dichotomopilus funicola TaxID=1934379 RepID=A0AAN6V5U1_9PEZI|nr:hypothetical protein C8A04DRAFT_27047 [Dichotomopilus funicola]
MAAALHIRIPTLQTLPLPSIILRCTTLNPQPFKTSPSPFSTTRITRNTNTNTNTSSTGASANGRTNANGNGDVNANGNPSYPKFSLKSIVPNPRMRKAIMAGLVVMAGMEGYMWVTYWPQIMGWVGYGGEEKKE